MHISKKILVGLAGSALAATMASCGGGRRRKHIR